MPQHIALPRACVKTKQWNVSEMKPTYDIRIFALIQVNYHKDKVYYLSNKNVVATPLWVKCEDETHTPKSGKLESFGTPKNSELDCKGQNTSHWGVLDVIGKVLKCRCPKWPRMSHLDICSPSTQLLL
jgi:hypothetical protein